MRVTCFGLHKAPVSCQLTRFFFVNPVASRRATCRPGQQTWWAQSFPLPCRRRRALQGFQDAFLLRVQVCASHAAVRRRAVVAEEPLRVLEPLCAVDYGCALAAQSVEAKWHDAELLADFGHEAALRVKGLPMADPFCACMKTPPTAQEHFSFHQDRASASSECI